MQHMSSFSRSKQSAFASALMLSACCPLWTQQSLGFLCSQLSHVSSRERSVAAAASQSVQSLAARQHSVPMHRSEASIRRTSVSSSRHQASACASESVPSPAGRCPEPSACLGLLPALWVCHLLLPLFSLAANFWHLHLCLTQNHAAYIVSAQGLQWYPKPGKHKN